MPRTKPLQAHNLKTTRSGVVKKRSVLWRMRRVLFLGGLFVVAAVVGVGYVLTRVPLPPEGPPPAQTSFLCAADVQQGCNADNALAEFHGTENRELVKLAQVPKVLQEAVLSAEDRDFFKHGGVDPFGIARAALADIRGTGSTQGGSTITQQYVKNQYLTDERTLNRKLKEAVISVKLEQQLSKRQILERYLNTVYFGRGAYGVQAAARTYFGHDVEQVTLPEAAVLAGLIRSPESGEPLRYPDEAKRRRLSVLDGMLKEKYITQDEHDFVAALPPEFGVLPRTVSQGVVVSAKGKAVHAEYFVEYVRQYLAAKYGDSVLYGGGLRIYTTLDLGQQGDAVDAVTSTLNRSGDPAGALVSIDDQGQIKAMMGGTDFEGNQVNLATGKEGGGSGRQPGSTFKPFALSEAVHEGYSIDSVFKSPSEITLDLGHGEEWKVRGGCCGGSATLEQATKNSVNTVFAQLMLALGPAHVIDMAHQLGVTADLPEVPSLVLGSGEVSVLDMASAYSTFANGGVHVDPVAVTRVDRADGSLVETFTPAPSREVLTPEENAKVVYCLQQVIQGGTGRAADFGKTAAGKTGTTSDNKDAWFAGFTPKLTAVVWMGYPGLNGEPVKEMRSVHGLTVQGGNLPAQMWRKFMTAATAGADEGSFPAPTDATGGRQLNPELSTSTSLDTAATTRPPTTSSGTTASTAGTTPTTAATTSSTRPPTTTTPTSPSTAVTTPTVPGGPGG